MRKLLLILLILTSAFSASADALDNCLRKHKGDSATLCLFAQSKLDNGDTCPIEYVVFDLINEKIYVKKRANVNEIIRVIDIDNVLIGGGRIFAQLKGGGDFTMSLDDKKFSYTAKAEAAPVECLMDTDMMSKWAEMVAE